MRRLIRSVANAVSTTVIASTTVVSVVPSLYLGLVSTAGWRRSPPAASGRCATRFAIVVPAHDEAAGIGATLESFRALDYPGDRFRVHVVADNCTDDTADVVRRHGFTVHERHDPDDPGKGSALNWLHDRLVAEGEPFDAVAVVDADTTVDRGFLAAMDREIERGAEAAQGYYSVRDPEASAATSFRFAALACRHHLRAQGRCRIGASCGLYGNGMVFRRELLDGRRWSGHLVEDAEFQNDLLLDGHPVRYVADAEVRAEMPESTAGATTQNQRWERGRLDLARRYVPQHLRRAVAGDADRLAHVDAALDHLVPPLSALVGIQAVAGAVATAGVLAGRPRARLALVLDVLAIGTVVAHALAGLASVGASRRHYAALLSAPRIAIWKIGVWLRVALPGADVAWTRTRRNDEVAA